MWKVIFLALFLFSQSHQASIPQNSTYEYAVDAIFGIGVRLQVLLDEPSQAAKNFLVSPLSAAFMVGQLMIGAEGQFRQELYNLLSLPDEKTQQQHQVIGYYYKHNNSHVNFTVPYYLFHLQLSNLLRDLNHSKVPKLFNLTTSNALFVNSILKLKKDFAHNLQLYKTYIEQLDFVQNPVGSQEVINNWAATKTNNLIRTILPTPPSASDAAIFTNAVYFKADWVTPFSFELTQSDIFYVNENQNISVEYMRGFIEDIVYGESSKLDCKMIGLPYKGKEVVMYILLPNESNGTEYNIKNFSSKLNAKDVFEFINDGKKHDVNVQLPKMKLSNSLSILKPLQKVQNEGKPPVNGGDLTNLYLTNATEDVNLKVSDILQQMTLSVDEMGTEAAAVSASITNYIGTNKNFKIDRPFLFFIRHEPTSAILFWGSIVNPAQEE